MSTISLPNEDQIRHFFVADAVATETTAATFRTAASIGEIQIFDANGNAFDFSNAPADGGDFYIAKINQKGTVSKSDFITPADITYLNGTAPRAKTGKTQVFTLGGAPTVGAEYRLSGKIHYGNSEENFITFVVGTLAVTGDTADTVLTRLAEQMANNLAMSVNTSTEEAGQDTIIAGTTVDKNKYFTLSVASSALTVAEKDWILQDYRPGLRTHDQLLWNFEVQTTPETEFTSNVTKTATVPVFATGQGYQMIELERFLVGHRAEFETKDVTLSFGREYDAQVGSTYYALDLKYFDVSRDDPKRSNKMLTIISTDAEVVDAIGFAIEAQMGFAEGTKWTELDPAGDGADNV